MYPCFVSLGIPPGDGAFAEFSNCTETKIQRKRFQKRFAGVYTGFGSVASIARSTRRTHKTGINHAKDAE